MWSWLVVLPAVLTAPFTRPRAIKGRSAESAMKDTAEKVSAQGAMYPVFPDELEKERDRQNR